MHTDSSSYRIRGQAILGQAVAPIEFIDRRPGSLTIRTREALIHDDELELNLQLISSKRMIQARLLSTVEEAHRGSNAMTLLVRPLSLTSGDGAEAVARVVTSVLCQPWDAERLSSGFSGHVYTLSGEAQSDVFAQSDDSIALTDAPEMAPNELLSIELATVPGGRSDNDAALTVELPSPAPDALRPVGRPAGQQTPTRIATPPPMMNKLRSGEPLERPCETSVKLAYRVKSDPATLYQAQSYAVASKALYVSQSVGPAGLQRGDELLVRYPLDPLAPSEALVLPGQVTRLTSDTAGKNTGFVFQVNLPEMSREQDIWTAYLNRLRQALNSAQQLES